MGAEGGKLGCILSCALFLFCIGMAEATACEGGDGGDVERPAGVAMEVGKMKSSMFMASASASVSGG